MPVGTLEQFLSDHAIDIGVDYLHRSYPQAFLHDAVDVWQFFEVGKRRDPLGAADSIQLSLSLILNPRVGRQEQDASSHRESTRLSSSLHQGSDKVGKLCPVKCFVEFDAFVLK